MGKRTNRAAASATVPFVVLPVFAATPFCPVTADCSPFLLFIGAALLGFAGWTAPLARALVTPDVDSALETGQNPPLGFFFVDAAASALLALDPSFVCVTVAVEEVELLDAKDEEELLRDTTFRWGINIRETSSVLMAEKPP